MLVTYSQALFHRTRQSANFIGCLNILMRITLLGGRYLFLQLAAAAVVVATTVVGDSVTATIVTVAANQDDNDKDNNPCAVVTAVE